MQDVLVSIVCNTFNHEEYIEDAINGFLMQKTNFKYEILIHDDASTDKTVKIIKEYQSKFPDLINPIFQTENQYSKKKQISLEYQFPRAKGKYIALCEGDDYWTDENKLQKQFDVLESHPNISMCAHSVSCVNARTKEFIRLIQPENESVILPIDKVIKHGGGYIGTNSLFFKKEILEDFPRSLKPFFLDYTLQIFCAAQGGIYYINECMSAYRVLSKNSFTSKMKNNKQSIINHYKKDIKMLEIFNKETENKYNESVIQAINRLDRWVLINVPHYKFSDKKRLNKTFLSFSLKEKIKFIIKLILCVNKD